MKYYDKLRLNVRAHFHCTKKNQILVLNERVGARTDFWTGIRKRRAQKGISLLEKCNESIENPVGNTPTPV